MAITPEELRRHREWLSEDLRLEMGDDDAAIHVDEPGKRVLYLINPREVKFFPLSLMAAAGVFHAAGESWTISSKFYDVTNYGFYSGDDAAAAEMTGRRSEEAERLGVEEIILSECGHGFRSFRWEGPNWLRREYPVPMRSVLELLEEYLDDGPHPGRSGARTPSASRCTIPATWCAGAAIVEPQRADPAAGGRGLRRDDPQPPAQLLLRRRRRDALDERVRRAAGGIGPRSRPTRSARPAAKIVATPCHNCADQLIELNKKLRARRRDPGRRRAGLQRAGFVTPIIDSGGIG